MLVNYWDKYTEMHGQQNVKIWYSIVLYRRYFAIKFITYAQRDGVIQIQNFIVLNVLTVLQLI